MCTEGEIFVSLLLTLCLFSPCVSTVNSSITLGSKLSSAVSDQWVSPNGNFAFGFYNRSSASNLCSAGIHFNSVLIPLHQQPVVWIVGADITVSCSALLLLTETGDLVLIDDSMVMWRSNTRHMSVASASLLDTGNLVLFDANHSPVWQSFDTPSNTLLPGQNISALRSLRAASTNLVSSHYSLSIDSSSGQLKLSWETNVTYWKSNSPSPVVRAIFTNSGALQLVDQSLTPRWSYFPEDHNDSSVHFRFLRLDVDGNLRLYSWSHASLSWTTVWQALENQCDVFDTCGLQGVCGFSQSGTVECKCPFWPTNDESTKCLVPYAPNCNYGAAMITLTHTFLYGVYPPNDLTIQSSAQMCKKSCLQDPFCTSITIPNDGTGECLTRRTRYVTGYHHPSVAATSYVKVCSDPLAVLPRKAPASLPPSPSPHSAHVIHGVCLHCLVGATAGSFLAFALIQIGICLCYLKNDNSQRVNKALMDLALCSRSVMSLSYGEIKGVTKDFSIRLGPRTFKGTLQCGQPVVVKCLNSVERAGVLEEKQLRCTVLTLGHIHHKNLVKLVGYCFDAEKRFLVYEFYKNGSVGKWVEDDKLSRRLTWRKRMDICVGVGRAIAYLHTGCRKFISHGRLHWGNVLLDDELQAKVMGYGMTEVVGCMGDNVSSAEHDVVRFGEMIVSFVSGRNQGEESCRWAHAEWLEGRLETVVDSRIQGGYNGQEMEQLLRLAFWCVQRNAWIRPGFGEVLKVLMGTLTVDIPPFPFD